jgi:hypothetical protein
MVWIFTMTVSSNSEAVKRRPCFGRQLKVVYCRQILSNTILRTFQIHGVNIQWTVIHSNHLGLHYIRTDQLNGDLWKS